MVPLGPLGLKPNRQGNEIGSQKRRLRVEVSFVFVVSGSF